MNNSIVWSRRAGLTLHCLVGAVMLLAGTVKVLGLAPPEQVEKMGLTDVIRLIGVGEVASGLLLMIPRTTPIGILLTSSFWGGAICLHMSRGGSYVAPVVLLLMSWGGAYLREAVWALGSGGAAPAPASVPRDSATTAVAG
jgi:hypothetical protein